MSENIRYFQNTDGSLYKEERVVEIVHTEDPVTKALIPQERLKAVLTTGLLQEGATRIAEAVYERTLQHTKDEYNRKVKELNESVEVRKQTAVQELVKLGISQESATIIVYK